jgi:uncharacterized protein YciI
MFSVAIGHDRLDWGGPMSDWFAVVRTRGVAWDESLSLREQALWDPHADYMDGVEAAGFIRMAGPLEGTRDVLIIVRAESPEDAEARLAEDPWTASGHLRTVRIAPWNVLVGRLD